MENQLLYMKFYTFLCTNNYFMISIYAVIIFNVLVFLLDIVQFEIRRKEIILLGITKTVRSFYCC